MKDFGLGTEVRITHRFKIGDRIHVIGILASFYSGKTGVVIGVEPNPHGIEALDSYVVEISGVTIGNKKFADFQLAPAAHITRRAQVISD
jgi:ribosomal protein L21E